MDLASLFQKRERLTSIDIGASSVKLIELELGGESPKLANLGSMPIDGEVFTNHVITNVDKVADSISALLDANGVDEKRVITCVPGPTVFTKRIKTQRMPYNDLVTNVQFEASNFIPHNINDVRLDFHILNEIGKNQLELLVLAVKNEVIDAILDALSMAGLEAAIVDIDYFAMQNIFEFSYPEHVDETVALVDFGARYSTVNIVQKGQSLFTGDVTAGSSVITDKLEEAFEMSRGEAESLTRDCSGNESARTIIEGEVDLLAKEFNRQLSFFWSAAGADHGIDRIVLTGGASNLPGFVESLHQVTSLPCEPLDTFKNITIDDRFDDDFVNDLSPRIAVACGMALRETGDRIIPEELL